LVGFKGRLDLVFSKDKEKLVDIECMAGFSTHLDFRTNCFCFSGIFDNDVYQPTSTVKVFSQCSGIKSSYAQFLLEEFRAFTIRK
jgi:hypothetical protein